MYRPTHSMTAASDLGLICTGPWLYSFCYSVQSAGAWQPAPRALAAAAESGLRRCWPGRGGRACPTSTAPPSRRPAAAAAHPHRQPPQKRKSRHSSERLIEKQQRTEPPIENKAVHPKTQSNEHPTERSRAESGRGGGCRDARRGARRRRRAGTWRRKVTASLPLSAGWR